MKKRRPKHSRTMQVLKRIVNIRSWADFDRIRAFTLYLANGFRKFFIPNTNESRESFHQAQQRLNLTEQQLLSRQKGLFRLAIMMVAIAILVFCYLVYELFSGHYISAFLSLFVIGIALVLAFRYHFWYFQIKERKLGCTFQQWWREGLRGEKR